MLIFENFELGIKKKLVVIWKAMNESDRSHFINQVALALSVLGNDEKGKKIAEELVLNMLEDGSKNLSDFGLYLEFLGEKTISGKEEKVAKVSSLVESYRFKHGLPSEPAREFIFNEK